MYIHSHHVDGFARQVGVTYNNAVLILVYLGEAEESGVNLAPLSDEYLTGLLNGVVVPVSVNTLLTAYYSFKDGIAASKKEAAGKSGPRKKFQKPSVDDVRAYCMERRNRVDAQSFVDFYESKGWKVGKTPMVDWKAAVRTWERSQKASPIPDKPNPQVRFLD